MSTENGSGRVDDRLANLSPAQRALLERRLIERRTAAAKRSAITRRTVTSPCPLSYAQELLWLLSQVFDDGIAYNAPGAFQLEGRLDLDLLARSFAALMDRHEVLRTTYSVIDGEPMQIIHPSLPIELNVVDLRAVAPDARAGEAQRVLKQESRFAFDLVRGPVIRPTVIRLSDDAHILMVNMHHVATDGYSRSALYRDLSEFYEAFAEGRPPSLPALAVQYADYAIWQRQWLDGGVGDAQLEYWKRQLARAPSRLDLPTDFGRPPVRSWVGDNMSMMLDMQTREGLRTTARGGDATLFVALLSTFATLLGRYAGQDEVVIGTPFAGRNRTELESMVGYFINPLALRVDLTGDPTFTELLGRVRETTLEAFAHADVPYETVVRATNPERDLSQTPVFQAMIVLHNPAWQTQRPKFQPAGIRCAEITHEKGWSKFDVLLGMSERTTGLNTTWEYSTELFTGATVQRMMEHFRTLAESVAANPDRPLSRLPMLTEGERTKLVVSWSGGGQELPARDTVKDLFEEQVQRTPDAPAVVFASTQLTFEELNRRANRVAARLTELGVGPGSLVGVLLEKSLDLLPAVLGVVKSGGAYIPLDPAYPADRIEFMVGDAAPQVLLTHSKHREVAPASEATTLEIDTDERLAAMSDENPPTRAQGTDLAYIIYTSGSTGKPKGAMIANRSLTSAFFAYERAYRLRELSAHLQMASFSFDVFTGDMIRSLLAGAKLVLCPIDVVVDPPALHELMRRERVDAAEFVPATASLLFEHLEREGGRLDFMKLVIVSSEAWRNEKYLFFRRLCGADTRLVNSYGLTEATIDSTWFEAAPDASLPAGRFVPIGRPLDNSRIYVLDAHLEPQPIGVPGELCVGGVAVARGYLNRPELTAERFVPDPFSEDPDGLLYRTGDRVRWLADGTIDFLGRIDRQIKIRGFRIEPGEIESVLERHPRVHGAAVVDRTDPRGEVRLVAYLETSERSEELTDVRAFLSEQVPNYMVPSAFVAVAELPLTPNGKVDRDALADPEWGNVTVRDEFVEPRTDTERALAAIWCEILGLERVGVSDDFFDVGGHSLMAVRLFTAIERKLGARLPLSSVFETSTIEGLAQMIDGHHAGETRKWPLVVELRRGGDAGPPLFLTAWAGGEVLPYRELVGSIEADRTVYGLMAPGVDRASNPLSSVESLAAYYVERVREVQPSGPYCVGGYCFSGLIAYEMARILIDEGETVTSVVMIDSYPFREMVRPGRIELERAKFQAFKSADMAGKVAWLRRRVNGLRSRGRNLVYARRGPILYEQLAARGLAGRIPRRPWNLVLIASNLARRNYRPTPLDVRIDFFRAQTAPDAQPTPWEHLAGGGVVLHQVVSTGIDHAGMMHEPHVSVLADQLSRALSTGDAGALERVPAAV